MDVGPLKLFELYMYSAPPADGGLNATGRWNRNGTSEGAGGLGAGGSVQTA